jgi:hypothetical protein
LISLCIAFAPVAVHRTTSTFSQAVASVASLNRKRFALSVAIIGAVVTPIWTGSLRKADRHSWVIEDDAKRYQQAHGLKLDACFLAQQFTHHYDDDNERKICEDSDSLRGQNEIVKEMFNPMGLVPLMRDIVLGFLAPLAFVFFVPPLARAYYQWITAPPK